MSLRTHIISPVPWVLWLTLLILLPLSLIDFPRNGLGEALREYSNLGHVVFFAILAHLLLDMKTVQQLSLRQRIFTLILSALLIGGLIELLQSMTSREPNLIDVLRDVAGALLVIVFLMPQRVEIRRWKQLAVQCFVVVLVLYDALLPSLRLYDRQIAAHQFPVLSNLEYVTEGLRWSSGQRVESPVREGQYALKMNFSTDEYSTIAMNYLPYNWQGFKTLRFSVYNPAVQTVALWIKIHDRKHYEYDQEYLDRFNRSWLLTSGWNDISIDMMEIETAPATRNMDMNEIARLQFFTHNLSRPHSLYFDAIQLSQKP